MNFIKKIVPVFITLAVLAVIVVFRTIPTGQLWEGYTVLYVPSDANDEIVQFALTKAGVEEFISLSQQKVPLDISNNSPELAMLKINRTKPENTYLYNRNNYFYDSTGAYRLYYIPNIYKGDLNICLDALEDFSITGGIDSSISYPFILPVIVTALAILLIIFSKRKFMFALTELLPVLFVFCNPFYTAAISTVLLFLCLIMITTIWKRKNYLKTLSKNYFIYILPLIGAVLCFSTKILTGVMFLLVLLSDFCIILIFDEKEKKKKSKDGFNPVFIKSASKVSVYGKKQNVVFPSLIICIVLIFVCFTFSNNSKINGRYAKILLPGSDAPEKSELLPDLDDYCKWTWNVRTAPYKSMNKQNYSDEYIVYPSFENADTNIKQIDKYLYYNDEYKAQTIDGIQALSFPSIEKVLINQNKSNVFGFTSTGSYNVSFFSIIIMLIGFIMLLFIYFSAIIRKGGKK